MKGDCSDGCKPNSCSGNVKTTEHIVGDIVTSSSVDYMVKKCTYTFDVTPLHAQVQSMSSVGAVHLWAILLSILFKNKIIPYIYDMSVMLVTFIMALYNFNVRLLYKMFECLLFVWMICLYSIHRLIRYAS